MRGHRERLLVLLAKSENDDRLIAALQSAAASPASCPPRPACAAGAASGASRLPAGPAAVQPQPPLPHAAAPIEEPGRVSIARPVPASPLRTGGSAATLQLSPVGKVGACGVQVATINISMDICADDRGGVTVQSTVTSPTKAAAAPAVAPTPSLRLLPAPQDPAADRACAAAEAAESAASTAGSIGWVQEPEQEPEQEGAEPLTAACQTDARAAEEDAFEVLQQDIQDVAQLPVALVLPDSSARGLRLHLGSLVAGQQDVAPAPAAEDAALHGQEAAGTAAAEGGRDAEPRVAAGGPGASPGAGRKLSGMDAEAAISSLEGYLVEYASALQTPRSA